jgi:hypothetical protein
MYYRSQQEKSTLFNSKRGAKLKLVRKPKNEFDGNAVAIYVGTAHVGWMSRSDATVYGPAMDEAGLKETDGELVDVFDKYPIFTFQLPRRAVEWVEKEIRSRSSDFA